MEIMHLHQSCFSLLSIVTKICNRFSRFQVLYHLKIIQFALNTIKEVLGLSYQSNSSLTQQEKLQAGCSKYKKLLQYPLSTL